MWLFISERYQNLNYVASNGTIIYEFEIIWKEVVVA
jgi:hypothetical protein